MNAITPESLVAHADGLYAFARRRVDDHHHAEDLVQQCLVVAWRKRETYRGEAVLKTWLVGILKFLILDYQRLARKTPTHESNRVEPGGDDLASLDVVSGGDYLFASVIDSPSETAQRAEVLSLIQECIDQLPIRTRLIFILREVEGLAVSEIAAAAGVTAGSASVLLTRARFKLRACLEHRGVNSQYFSKSE